MSISSGPIAGSPISGAQQGQTVVGSYFNCCTATLTLIGSIALTGEVNFECETTLTLEGAIAVEGEVNFECETTLTLTGNVVAAATVLMNCKSTLTLNGRVKRAPAKLEPIRQSLGAAFVILPDDDKIDCLKVTQIKLIFNGKDYSLIRTRRNIEISLDNLDIRICGKPNIYVKMNDLYRLENDDNSTMIATKVKKTRPKISIKKLIRK